MLSGLSVLQHGRTTGLPASSMDRVVDSKPGTTEDDMDPGHEGRRSSSATQGLQKKARKRKGSLRKTALLGTSNSRVERKSHLEELPLRRDADDDRLGPDRLSVVDPRREAPTPASLMRGIAEASAEHGVPTSSSSSSSSVALHAEPKHTGHGSHKTSIASRSIGEASTTDEEDLLSISYRTSASLSATQSIRRRPSASSTSYFPPLSPSPSDRRHAKPRPKSPLSASPARSPDTPDEWDYAETERWGWVVLVVTWIVFVVGMGSCLGVWSWAWDVGETPYAPPELEDDPTLPIVGYYPALMILTMVMAWVWVVIAWIGMKYFRHAKISSEDI